MRQASWIAFLLLAVGLLTYDAVLEKPGVPSSDEVGEVTIEAPEGGMTFPEPRP